MWAMIPMFRVFSSGIARVGGAVTAGMRLSRLVLIAEMGERLVRLRHLVGVLLALDGGTDTVGGIHELAGEPVGHAATAAAARVADDPPPRECGAPVMADLDRNLVGRPADALGLDLEHRGHVAQGSVEDVERLPSRGV